MSNVNFSLQSIVENVVFVMKLMISATPNVSEVEEKGENDGLMHGKGKQLIAEDSAKDSPSNPKGMNSRKYNNKQKH